MKRKFFIYPYARTPCILYENEKLRKTVLFRSLMNKMFGDTLKRKFRNNFCINALFKPFSYIYIHVPHPNAKLIYIGYDRTVFFVLKGDFEVDYVYTVERKSAIIKKQKFLGYPIFWNKNAETIENKSILTHYLKTHWVSLRNGSAKMHGDFTPFNLLLSENGQVTAIDHSNRNEKSLLFDHFYFYAYFLHMLDFTIFRYPKNYRHLEHELNNIYREIFEDENKKFLQNEIKKIDLNQFKILKIPKIILEQFADCVI